MSLSYEFNDILKIAEIEKDVLPLAFNEIDAEFIIQNFEDYVKEIFKLSGLEKYSSQIYLIGKYTFAYTNRKYYVMSIAFPFENTKDFIGCLKRGYLVFTNDSKKLHFFGEKLTDLFPKAEIRLQLFYFTKYKDGILHYIVMDRTLDNDKRQAEQLPSFVYGAVYNGVAGYMVKPEEIFNMSSVDGKPLL